ncbi:Uncharacterized protein HZ326_1600 [Fusarium oxysporum f. sp. albedinis]|nr:Uncharacterized protein HZ326_1600 [Fusarium oxysporum f. sp. albedinis]
MQLPPHDRCEGHDLGTGIGPREKSNSLVQPSRSQGIFRQEPPSCIAECLLNIRPEFFVSFRVVQTLSLRKSSACLATRGNSVH